MTPVVEIELVDRSMSQSNAMLSGLGISPGLAVGQAFVFRDILHDLERYDIGTHQVEYEHGRIERAVERVLADLGCRRSASRRN